MILTVTLNAALDRTMTVPNFPDRLPPSGDRYHHPAGWEGRERRPSGEDAGPAGIATGFVGGRKGDQILADLNGEGILSDFVRVEGSGADDDFLRPDKGNFCRTGFARSR